MLKNEHNKLYVKGISLKVNIYIIILIHTFIFFVFTNDLIIYFLKYNLIINIKIY